MDKQRVVVLGGDGFCGWPVSLALSNAGYDVTIIDNFSRRDIDEELGTNSLTEIATMEMRVKTWRKLTGKRLYFKRVDVARNYSGVLDVLRKLRPDTVVHFAEQRAAPYSMKSPFHKRYTVNNNVMATHNLLCALVELDIKSHVVHLGTMGVYGYGTAGVAIPEGYVDCDLIDPETGDSKRCSIYYPSNPGSIYHMTKVIDTNLLAYYHKNDNVQVTDLHQGVVWGVQTDETELEPLLFNRFDYDGDYGTVINRFIVQAMVNHPLTVYGTGGQTRAFIHIKDMVKCIVAAVQNPPEEGAERVRVWNQTTEQLKLLDIANMVAEITGAKIRYFSNPRNEDANNTLQAVSSNIKKMAIKDPILLTPKHLDELCQLAKTCAKRVYAEKVICTSLWNKTRRVDRRGETSA